MVQYPDTYGGARDWSPLIERAHASGTMVVACTDLLASVLLRPVGEMGFDIAVGSAQRFVSLSVSVCVCVSVSVLVCVCVCECA